METPIESSKSKKRKRPPEQPDQKKPIWTINNILPYITVLLAILSIINYIQGRINSYQINRQQYELNSLNYKPQLEISCQLTNIQFKCLNPYYMTGECLDTIGIGPSAKFNANINISVKNIGKETARILMFSYSYNSPSLRRSSKSDSPIPEFVRYYSAREYWPNLQINPQEVFNRYIEDSETNYIYPPYYTFNFWIVYKNDLGMIYDTYFWYNARIIDSITGLQTNPVIVKMTKPFTNNDFHIYTKMESDIIKEKLNKWEKCCCCY
jgi:hypothetical protein